jgi:4-hydroxy-tetrahydrodipicolinate synthase
LPSTVLRIANEAKNVVAIKEAAGNIEQVMDLARILPKDFILLSGDDILVLPHMACGGHGVISVIGNAFPKEFNEIIKLANKGDYPSAKAQQLKFMSIIRNIFAEGNPGGIKEVLKHLNICEEHMRLPLYPVSKELSQKLYSDIADLG